MKRLKVTLLTAFMALAMIANPVKKKIIDEGGSGPYKAEAITESTLPGFVVYKPADMLNAVTTGGPLPLVVFANGGCNDTSLPHEKMLNDLASYGYMVIALGEMQDSINDRKLGKSPNSDMIKAIDWAEKANADSKSGYLGAIDMEYVALAGQSCGGAQVLANAGDPRVKTYIMLNSGMGDITMAEASSESLKNLHGPILYIIGGESDIAYNNAELDYERISHVPVAFANQLKAGHGGTFGEQFGGSFSRMARTWLSWQFKDQRNNLDVFLRNRMHSFADYTMKAKNFPEVNQPFEVKEMPLTMSDGKRLWGKAYIPNGGEERKALVIMAHGYNGNFLEPQAYAETLAMNGIASYVFDFCGGSNYSQSEGTTTDMTVFTEKSNVEDIAKAAKTWEFVDSTRMALLGCSQGGLVAALTAGANPDLFKSIILVYPALLIPDTAPAMLQKFDADGGKPQEVMGMKLGRRYYEVINGIDAADSLKAYKGDIFIVYGDNDMVIRGGHIDKVAAQSDKVLTQVIPGGTHGFGDYRHHEQASQGILQFAMHTLSKRHERRAPEFNATYPDVHDPVMAYEDGRYYIFTTGFGIGMMSSADMKTWRPEKAPLDPIPSWASTPVPAYKGHTWAPDIIKYGDKWYLYYSCSTFGKNISVIGVATNKTLNPDSPDYKWEDLGLVIQSEPGVTDWNAIDPNIIIDDKGNPWMTFGSFWDGIQLVQLEKDMKTPIGKPKTVARRRSPCSVAHGQPTANTNAIEAPFIVKNDGYYYLFVSYDFCCKGLSSNYKTAVGRSKTVDGPYVDKQGRAMTDTGGEILIGETDNYSGIGHCSVYNIDGKWHFAAHGYDKKLNGASKLILKEVNWIDGWPILSEE